MVSYFKFAITDLKTKDRDFMKDKQCTLTCNCEKLYKASNKQRDEFMTLIPTKSTDGFLCDYCRYICFKKYGHTIVQDEAYARKLRLSDPKHYEREKGRSHVSEWHKRGK